MTYSRSPATALVLVIAALTMGACGGSSNSEPGSLDAESLGAAKTKQSTSASDKRSAAEPSDDGRSDDKSRSQGSLPQAAKAGLSRAQIVNRGDAICRDAHERSAHVGRSIAAVVASLRAKKIGAKTYFARSGALTKRAARIAEDALRDLRAIKPAAPDRRLRGYLQVTAGEVKLLYDEADALRRRDSAQVRELNGRLSRLITQARSFASAYGFRTCAGGT